MNWNEIYHFTDNFRNFFFLFFKSIIWQFKFKRQTYISIKKYQETFFRGINIICRYTVVYLFEKLLFIKFKTRNIVSFTIFFSLAWNDLFMLIFFSVKSFYVKFIFIHFYGHDYKDKMNVFFYFPKIRYLISG